MGGIMKKLLLGQYLKLVDCLHDVLIFSILSQKAKISEKSATFFKDYFYYLKSKLSMPLE